MFMFLTEKIQICGTHTSGGPFWVLANTGTHRACVHNSPELERSEEIRVRSAIPKIRGGGGANWIACAPREAGAEVVTQSG